MLDLNRARKQCRIDDDDTSQDDLLALFIEASKAAIRNQVYRPLYWSPGERPSDPATVPPDAMDAPPDLELAALLLVGHYYKNREASTDTAQGVIPMGVEALCNPYRVINL